MLGKREISLIQVLILIISIFSFSYLINPELKIVSANDKEIDWDNPEDVIIDDRSTDLSYNYWEYNPDKSQWVTDDGEYTLSNNEMKKTFKTEGFHYSFKNNDPGTQTQEDLPDHSSLGNKIGKKLSGLNLPSFNTNRKTHEDNFKDLAGESDTYSFTRNDKTYTAKINEEGEREYYSGSGTEEKNKIEDKGTISELDSSTGLTGIGAGATLTSSEFWIKGVGGNLIWAVTTYGAIKTLGGSILGLDDEETDAFSKAASAGLFVGKSVAQYFESAGGGKGLFGTSSTTTGAVAGLAVAAVVYYATYEDKTQITITYTCAPWEAPTGGEDCEKCNNQDIPCSEYQCKSLGQACELLNPDTNESKCAWVNKNDAEYPIITLNEKVLTDGCEYSNTDSISPPDRGVRITYNGDGADKEGCIPPFTPIRFGITTNEPSKCKISTEREPEFDDMSLYFGGSSTFKYNHSQELILPDPDELEEGVEIRNNGEFELYTRCADANGNHNTANYVFQYCVQEGPDLTAPIIRKTSIESGTPIAYNTSETDITLYTNEPAKCKWDFDDKDYESMSYNLTSDNYPNDELLYESTGELTGIRNDATTSYYFRCKDNSDNSNQESKQIDLIGTLPLTIDEVSPNDTSIKDSVTPARIDLTAKTRGGYDDGKAICYYSEEEGGDFIQFGFDGDDAFNRINNQDIYLTAGDKTYYIKCIDKAGNDDVKEINFEVEEDKGAPEIARVYKEEDYLKLITNEKSSCVYDTKNCDYEFEQGMNMSRLGDTRHFVDWDTDTNFYIKCQDEFKNRPSPKECSITVKPTKKLEQR